MKDRVPILYLTHVLESIELASAYVEGVDYQRFSESQQLQDAVIRRVDSELIWAVVQRDLPWLALDVRGLVARQRSGEGPA